MFDGSQMVRSETLLDRQNTGDFIMGRPSENESSTNPRNGLKGQSKGRRQNPKKKRGTAKKPFSLAELKRLNAETLRIADYYMTVATDSKLKSGLSYLLAPVKTLGKVLDHHDAWEAVEKADSNLGGLAAEIDKTAAIIEIHKAIIDKMLDISELATKDVLTYKPKIELCKKAMAKVGIALNVLSLMSESLKLIDAIREDDELGILQAAQGVVSSGGSLFIIAKGGLLAGGSAASVFSVLIAWYGGGLLLMGRIGGIIKELKRDQRKAEILRLFDETVKLAEAAQSLARRQDALLDVLLKEPAGSSLTMRSDAWANHYAMTVGTHLNNAANRMEVILNKNNDSKTLKKAIQEIYPGNKIDPREVISDVRYGLNLADIRMIGNEKYALMDMQIYPPIVIPVANAVIIAGLTTICGLEWDSKELQEMRSGMQSTWT